MENKEIVNQIKRCLVGACDDTCPYYRYEEKLCVSTEKFLPIAEEFLNEAESALVKMKGE